MLRDLVRNADDLDRLRARIHDAIVVKPLVLDAEATVARLGVALELGDPASRLSVRTVRSTWWGREYEVPLVLHHLTVHGLKEVRLSRGFGTANASFMGIDWHPVAHELTLWDGDGGVARLYTDRLDVVLCARDEIVGHARHKSFRGLGGSLVNSRLGT